MAGLAIIAIVGVAAILFLPKLADRFTSKDDKERDQAREENRERKGFFGNTYDFFLGEGKYDALFAGDAKSGGGTSKPTGGGAPTGAAPRGKGRGRIA